MPNASSRPLRYNCIHTGKHTYILAETHTQTHADTQFLAHAYAKRCKVAKWLGRYNRIAAADTFSPLPPPPLLMCQTRPFLCTKSFSNCAIKHTAMCCSIHLLEVGAESVANEWEKDAELKMVL